MQTKGLTALLAATVLVAVAAVALSLGGARNVADAGSGEVALAGLADKIGDVTALKIGGAGANVTLQRQSQGWTIPEKGGFAADPAKIRQVLLGFAELTLVEPKTRSPDAYNRLDVEDPGKEGGHSRLIEIDDASGKKLAELIVGKRRPDRLGSGADGLYIRRPGDAQSWLAQGSVDLPTDTKDWLDKKIVSIAPARIAAVTLTHADGSMLVIKRDKEDAKLAVEGAPADSKLKNDAAVAEPAGVLDGLELSDVRPAAEVEFPSGGLSRAEWVTFDGLTITGETFDKDGTSWLRLKASGSDKAADEAAAINARTASWAYAVFPYKSAAMKTKLADLIEAPKGS
jgi:Domain of unknown function (DUF4340)